MLNAINKSHGKAIKQNNSCGAETDDKKTDIQKGKRQDRPIKKYYKENI